MNFFWKSNCRWLNNWTYSLRSGFSRYLTARGPELKLVVTEPSPWAKGRQDTLLQLPCVKFEMWFTRIVVLLLRFFRIDLLLQSCTQHCTYTRARNAHVILIIQISGSSRLIHPTPTSTSSAAAAAAAAAAARATGPLDLSSMRAASTLHPFLQLQGCQNTLYVIHFKIEIYNGKVLQQLCSKYGSTPRPTFRTIISRQPSPLVHWTTSTCNLITTSTSSQKSHFHEMR